MENTECNGIARGKGNGSRTAPRVRSRVACQRCNRRKVRCDVALTGCPCANCQRDGDSCVVLPRKKHRPRRKRNTLPSDIGTLETEESQASAKKRNALNGSEHESSPPEISVSLSESEALPADNTVGSIDGESDAEDALDEPTVAQDTSALHRRTRNQRQSVYDLCHPTTPQGAGTYLAPVQPARQVHKPHEVEYMRQQNVYTTLPQDVCDDLVRIYFQHVHFFLPVVDASTFFKEYGVENSPNMSLLLLWSMLLASANFADTDLLQRAGFSSRKAMKAAMYERAKCLYDLDKGTDKLVLIQSVLLLGFWYSDPQDYTGAWYWIGIAISLAQAIGLHRSPRPTSSNQQLSPARLSLMRRIWWTCLVRDRWVSLAKGRPMRIHSEDCDTPMPAVEDILDELDAIPSTIRVKFMPSESRALSELWLRLVRISAILGGIMRLHYRLHGPELQATDIDNFAHDLQTLTPGIAMTDVWNDKLNIHARQIELFYQAAIAILYRPYVLNDATRPPSGAHSLWKRDAMRRARTAASNTNNLLQGLIESDGIKYLKPMIITAMIPAMQIHLADCKSADSLNQALGKNKLQLCMLVLSNLRATYWSANVMYRLFNRAQNILGGSDTKNQKAAKLASAVPQPGYSVDVAPDEAEAEVQRIPPSSQQNTTPSFSLGSDTDLGVEKGSEQAERLWFSTSPQFNDVDQLLSPGFSLSEDVFLDFFPHYATSIYNQNFTLPNQTPDGTFYNNSSFQGM